ncbi:peptidase E [Actinokineospora sp. PR83]|uniref:Type 1 glutamine amidotransferase-like domain-containing protein n=1 Tax=Actinokineospora sp. PR83 TaxID=2884908 RepID=UPI001F2DA02E|nr:peptidase E [Actinokineospora sp. PR83]MCG8914900.1 peptidase E [Actinokineospora sp. PR83]
MKTCILATCMGFNRARDPWQPSPVFRYAFELAGNPSRPKVCFIPTASDDDTVSIESFYAAFADTDVETSHLALSADDRPRDLADFLGEQTLVWVDRGNVAKALEVWREHGLDQVLRDCYEHGVILGGESAGSLCWFAGGVTDSFGEVQAHRDGLGLLPYGNAVHYADRRQVFEGAMRAGELPSEGYAIDAGAGLHFQGHELVHAISDRKHASAYRVTANGSDIHEEPLDVTRLKRS